MSQALARAWAVTTILSTVFFFLSFPLVATRLAPIGLLVVLALPALLTAGVVILSVLGSALQDIFSKEER